VNVHLAKNSPQIDRITEILNETSQCAMEASAVEADRANNPKVVGSNPTPATKEI